LDQSDGSLLGAFCLQLAAPSGVSPSQFALDMAARLRPVLDCLHRELAAGRPLRARMQMLTERTAELQWLFSGTEKLTGATGGRQVVNELLAAATARLQCALGVLIVPERRIELEHLHDKVQGLSLRLAVGGLRRHLIAWAQRHHEPLVINGNAAAAPISANCKLLSVPVGREGGRVVGILVFCNPSEALDFCNRHIFLACHLGRQMAALVDAQFDLMTGLYTRGGLEQIYSQDHDDPSSADGSVVYVDVDRMQIVNELHGFELGDEVIVRIAELVALPGTAEGVLAARISGDRFALALPNSNTAVAGQLAANLRAAAAQLVIGPPVEPVEISISCGIAALVHMPQGLARALAAAELACKKAKERGRNRVEIYACDDSSMMRPHDDAIAVGQLRAAIKADRLILYAQRIAPLQNPSLPDGYELLMRLRDLNGDIVLPGPLVTAAQRYQLLPAIDRWVVRRSLELLSPYRNMFTTRGISMSINVSGQSIGDEAFVRFFTEQLKAACLPTGCVTVEITEQAAVTNLARANDMTRQLGALGCRVALDDFGTGANSLVSLKSLQIARVKIDGGFVRDIMTNERSQATIRAIVELAKGYSIDTVAEYVENSAIADTVRRLGVDYAQGYAIGKPQPLEELLASLGRDEPLDLQKMFLERG
jgi:diguanylate cyclase (GGDEF)-like protein